MSTQAWKTVALAICLLAGTGDGLRGQTPGYWISLPDSNGDSARGIVIGGVTRTYLVHGNPNTYATVQTQNGPIRVPRGLVLNFHPLCRTAADQRTDTGMNAKADAAGFVVVYPQAWLSDTITACPAGIGGTPYAWKAGDCCNTNAAIDDVAFAEQIVADLDALFATYPGYDLDAQRVFATGFSNGAFMAYRLACQSTVIKAIAPVAGVMSNSLMANCPGRTTVPVMHFNSYHDPIVKWSGDGIPENLTPYPPPTPMSLPGALTPFLLAPASTDWWNTCATVPPYHQSTNPPVVTAYGTVTCWTSGPTSTPNACTLPYATVDIGRVSNCGVDNVGGRATAHTWLGATGGLANDYMWDFLFSRFPYPAP